MDITSKEQRAMLGLSLGHFHIDLYAAILVPLYPLITTKLGIDLALISSIIAIGHLISSLMQPVFGYIADKLRHRIFMVWGLILSSIFLPLALKTNTVPLFLTCLLLGMLGNAFFHPQVSALLREFNKNNPKLTQQMGIFLGLGTIGYAIGPYMSTLAIKYLGENNFQYLSIFGLLACLIMYFFVPKMPSRDCYIKENFFFIMKEILKNRTCGFLVLVSTIKSAVSLAFGTFIPFLLKDIGFTLSQTGLVVTLFFIAGGFATMLSHKVENKVGTNGVVVISFLSILPLILLFLQALKYNRYLACILFILTGFFILLSVGVVLVKAQKAMPKYTGVISGAIQGFSWGLGALTLSPLGFLGQHFGIDKILILMAFVAFVVGIYTQKTKRLDNI